MKINREKWDSLLSKIMHTREGRGKHEDKVALDGPEDKE